MHWLGCGHWPREALVPWLQVLRRGAAPVEGHLPIFPQSAPAPAAPSMNTQQTVDVSRLPRQSRPLREPAQQRGDLHRSSPTVSLVGQQQGAGGGAAAKRQQNQGRRLSAGRTVGADARLTPGNYQRGLVAPHNPQGMSTCPVISPGASSAPENCTLEFGGRGSWFAVGRVPVPAIVLRVSRAGGVPRPASPAASAAGPSLSAPRRQGCACGAADDHETLNESLWAGVKPGDKAPGGDRQLGPGSAILGPSPGPRATPSPPQARQAPSPEQRVSRPEARPQPPAPPFPGDLPPQGDPSPRGAGLLLPGADPPRTQAVSTLPLPSSPPRSSSAPASPRATCSKRLSSVLRPFPFLPKPCSPLLPPLRLGHLSPPSFPTSPLSSSLVKQRPRPCLSPSQLLASSDACLLPRSWGVDISRPPTRCSREGSCAGLRRRDPAWRPF